ncbi:MAG TPA: EutN/CcmL family microcompartment protein [Acidobacteriota bacterium]|nr:EutN/CcmL family microcompartment protein [Acidobacteriota bacterium]
MVIGKVVDEMVATHKKEPFHGQKLLVVQPLSLEGEDWGEAILAIDGADAGMGDQVLLVQDGFAAMHVLGQFYVPVDAAVIGVIDHVNLY